MFLILFFFFLSNIIINIFFFFLFFFIFFLFFFFFFFFLKKPGIYTLLLDARPLAESGHFFILFFSGRFLRPVFTIFHTFRDIPPYIWYRRGSVTWPGGIPLIYYTPQTPPRSFITSWDLLWHDWGQWETIPQIS